MEKYEVLAIIGNGFDLAHGLKTSFYDFACYMLNSNSYQNIKLMMDYFEIVKQYSLKEENITIVDEWYDFEKIAQKMVSNFSHAEICSPKGFDAVYKGRKEYYCIISDINSALIKYFSKCEKERFTLLDSIKHYLSEKTIAINFNYTNTVRRYGCKQIFIHGSLEENEIVLGYDDYTDDGAYDFANYEDRYLLKEYGRERLIFSRWLSSQNICDSDTISKLKNEYLEFMKLTETCRGCEDGDYDIYDGRIRKFKEYYQDELSYNGLTDDVLMNIRHVVIMGHGIKSDMMLLDNILKKINPDVLEDITIFLYCGISLQNIKEQVNYFRRKFIFKENLIRFEEYKPGEIDTVLLKKIIDSINSY